MDEKKIEKLKLRQVEVIIKAIQNLGGIASYSQIYDEYGRITGTLMTVGRKAGIRKTIEQNSADSSVFNGNNIFYTPQKGSGMWGLTDEYINATIIQLQSNEKSIPVKEKESIKRVSVSNLPKRAKTPEEKLYKKIFREFNKVKYIGDISIDDEQYEYLIEYLKIKLLSIGSCGSSFAGDDDPVFAVALVQIGIREYNGRYWPHVSRITETRLDGNKQAKIGGRFYNTLVTHNKLHLDENEMVNNILMHCFITKHYASDFFEFLFAYYQYDLDRDLERHKEMRDYLLACMKKAEDSPRAFRIKKGTADAATANERGCKIRVYNILKWMDAYLFEDKLPENSPNRTAQFFVEWARRSKHFTKEKNTYYSRGQKQFRFPYIHFDIKSEEFKLVLPAQTVPLADNEESAELLWKINYCNITKTIDSETENTVIGCRNVDTEHLVIEPKDIFCNFRIELIKNETETIKHFAIKADSARFFDSDYDHITGTHLPEGNVFAFTERDSIIETDGYFDSDHYLKLNYYSLQLSKGNIVKKPDGRALSVSKELQEGLLEHNYVEGAAVYDGEHNLPIYSKAPSVLAKMKSSAQVGTMVVINGEKRRLEPDKCIIFKEDNSEYNYYLINLEDYCSKDDNYTVIIDVPSDRKNREYRFALIRDFSFIFLDAPYVFKSNGRIAFNDCLSSVYYDNNTGYDFDFDINSETSQLVFNVNNFEVYIDVPVFKWKFNADEKWNIEHPEELWHRELPDWIYFTFPSTGGYIFSDQDIIDEEDNQKISCTYDTNSSCYVCDTRKIRSWLELGSAVNHLFVQFDNTKIDFLTVVTSCILVSSSLSNSIETGQLILKSTILGFSDCVVDIYNNGELLADKLELTSNGAKLSTNKLYGEFELVFLEYDDDDDDFGEAVYSEFERKKYELKNRLSLVGKKIEVQYITEDKKTASIFSASKYDIKDRITVIVEKADEKNDNIYYGISQCSNPSLNKLKIQIEQIDTKNASKVLVFFYDEEEECYVDFVYDKKQRTILTSEDLSLSSTEARNRYLTFTPSNYYYIKISK